MESSTSNLSTLNCSEEENICNICFDVINYKNRRSECNHLFCKACIGKWIKQQFNSHLKTTCPICRKEVNFSVTIEENDGTQDIPKLNENSTDEDYIRQQLLFITKVKEFRNNFIKQIKTLAKYHISRHKLVKNKLYFTSRDTLPNEYKYKILPRNEIAKVLPLVFEIQFH